MRRAPLLPLLALGLSFAPVAAPPLRADAVDDYVRAEIAKQKIPGVAVVVTRKGEIVKAAGYGYSNLEHMVPVKPETIFQSGSTGKQLVAALAMLLVEDGKLDLDKPVKTYLPDAPATWDRITTRHLLSHTSGIADYGPELDLRRDHTDDERLKIMYALNLEFPAGARWNYSNSGYVTLGILLTRVGGAFYGDQLRERIFKPLGMTTTRILSEADVIPNRAAGYWLDGNEFKNQEWVSPVNNTTADGSLYWTILDLAKWADAQRREAVLKPESWRAMTTPVTLNSGKTYPYGFGLSISDWGGKKVIDHGGAWQGFTAHLARRVGEGEIAVAVLSNRSGADSGGIARAVMGLYEPEVAVRAFSPIDDPEPAKTAKVKDLLARFVAGGVTRDDFAYLRGGFQEWIVEGMKGSLAPLGTLQTLTLLERRELGDDVRLRYRGQFEKGETELMVQLTSDAKVSAIFLRKPG